MIGIYRRKEGRASLAQRPAPSIRTSLAARFVHTTTHRLRAVMSQRLWAAAAVLTVIAAPALSQNPPAPPPQPTQRPVSRPRPQRPAPSTVTVTTAVPSATASGITLDS